MTRPAQAEPTRGQSVVRLLLAVTGLLVGLFLLTLVPPFERQVPGTPITFETLVTAVVTVVVFGLLVVVADQLGELTRERLAGAPEARFPAHAGAAVQYLVIFLAFLVMYEPLARATVPFLLRNDTPWVYDLAFGTVSVVLLALVGYYAYRCLDPVAARVSGTFLDESTASTTDEDREAGAGDADVDGPDTDADGDADGGTATDGAGRRNR